MHPAPEQQANCPSKEIKAEEARRDWKGDRAEAVEDRQDALSDANDTYRELQQEIQELDDDWEYLDDGEKDAYNRLRRRAAEAKREEEQREFEYVQPPTLSKKC
jgi:chromosome segregation ATPase